MSDADDLLAPRPAAEDPGEPTPSRGRRLLRTAAEWTGTLLFGVLIFHGVGQLRAPDLPEQAPGFTLRDTDGATVALADLRGAPVVLNFWATWCGPCRVEIPSINAWAEDHPDVPVLGIAVDGRDPGFADKLPGMGIRYRVLLDDGATSAAYQVDTLPTTVVLDADGRVVDAHSGILTSPQLSLMISGAR